MKKAQNNDWLSISWKDAKQKVDNNELTIIGSNYLNINNQGTYRISADGTRLYKLSIASPQHAWHLIAKK